MLVLEHFTHCAPPKHYLSFKIGTQPATDNVKTSLKVFVAPPKQYLSFKIWTQTDTDNVKIFIKVFVKRPKQYFIH